MGEYANHDGQIVMDHLWWGDKLEVAVHDIKLGRTFRIQFERAIDGLLTKTGGGGYRGGEEKRMDAARELATEWVEDQLNSEVVDREEWARTKTFRGLSFNERKEFDALSADQLRELSGLLRRGEIELNDTKTTGADS